MTCVFPAQTPLPCCVLRRKEGDPLVETVADCDSRGAGAGAGGGCHAASGGYRAGSGASALTAGGRRLG